MTKISAAAQTKSNKVLKNNVPSLKDTKVNFLQNVKAPATFSEIKLSEALNEIKSGKYKGDIENIGKVKGKAAYRSAKEKLEVVRFNALVAQQRAATAPKSDSKDTKTKPVKKMTPEVLRTESVGDKRDKTLNAVFCDSTSTLIDEEGETGEVLNFGAGPSTPSAADAPKKQTTKIRDGDVILTCFTSTQHQSKTFSTRDDGSIHKEFPSPMWKGTAERLGFADKDFITKFPQILNKTTSNDALCYGVFKKTLGDVVDVVTKAKVVAGVNISRSKEHMHYSKGKALLMLDHDPCEYGPKITPSQLVDVLASIHASIGEAASVTRGSCSSGVNFKGKGPKADAGFHHWLVVKNGTDIPRYGAVLVDRLWLAGFGFIALGGNGAMLERTIIDGAVFGAERLDFEAKPNIEGDTLEYTAPTISTSEGGLLDTSTLIDLTPAEEKRVAKLKEAARLNPDTIKQAQDIRSLWIEERVAAMVARGASEDDARLKANATASGESQELHGDWILYFAGASGAVTVDDVLADLDTFNGKALADPIEGVDYGRTTAMFYANDGNPIINSQAHGVQTKYYLIAESDDDNNADDAVPKICFLVEAGKSAGICELTEQALKDKGTYFKNGNGITRLVDDEFEEVEKSDYPRVLDTEFDWKAYRLIHGVSKLVDIDVPKVITDRIFKAGGIKTLPTIKSVSRNPFLYKDEIVSESGFHEGAGIYGLFKSGGYSIGSSREEAEQALALLKELNSGFCFSDVVADSSYLLMAELLATVRPSLSLAPGLNINGNQPGAGKTTACKLIAAFATEKFVEPQPMPGDGSELEKTILSTLLRQHLAIIFDNLTKNITSTPSLAMIFTSTNYTARVLGLSKMSSASTRTLMLFNGNGVEVVGDMCRRIGTINLTSQAEGGTATQHKTIDPLHIMEADRPKYISAALTIINAWIHAGKPRSGSARVGNFSEWQDYCCEPLIWLGEHNPAQILLTSMQNDMNLEELAEFHELWWDSYGDAGVTANDIFNGTLKGAVLGTKTKVGGRSGPLVKPFLEKEWKTHRKYGNDEMSAREASYIIGKRYLNRTYRGRKIIKNNKTNGNKSHFQMIVTKKSKDKEEKTKKPEGIMKK